MICAQQKETLVADEFPANGFQANAYEALYPELLKQAFAIAVHRSFIPSIWNELTLL
jgi:hypothetical protein